MQDHEEREHLSLERFPRIAESRVIQSRTPHISLEWHLVDELMSHHELIVWLGKSITYGAYWDKSEIIECQSSEYGVLLVDQWSASPREFGEGYRVYLRREGYALIWREGIARRGFGEWRAVLRPLRQHEAVMVLGGRAGILKVFAQIARALMPLFKNPQKRTRERAASLASWLRAVPKEIKRLGL